MSSQDAPAPRKDPSSTLASAGQQITTPDKKTATGELKSTAEVPARFKDPNQLQYEVREQHPMYRTANSTFGSQPPTKWEMPQTYRAKPHTFTKTFNGHTYRDLSLNTALTKSRVIDRENFGSS